MDSNSYFCHIDSLNPATGFYFKGANQMKVCSEHSSDLPSEFFPISLLNLITSPDDIPLYRTRQAEAATATQYLDSLLIAATSEKHEALNALEEQRTIAFQALNDAYDAEVRRTEQHYRQIEVAISDHRRTFQNYLHSKAVDLSDIERQMTVDGQTVPNLMRSRVFSIEFDIGELAARSCSRGELPFDQHLSFFLSPVRKRLAADQLRKQATNAKDTKDFVELQRAVANGEESLRLDPQESTANLVAELTDKLALVRTVKKAAMIETFTKDTDSVTRLINYYYENVSDFVTSQDKLTIEAMLDGLSDILLPLSLSKATADVLSWSVDSLLSLDDYYDYRKAELWYKASLDIRKSYYSEEESTFTLSFRLSSVYFKARRYPEAEEYLHAALVHFESVDPNNLETAGAHVLQGRIRSAVSDVSSAASCFAIARRIYRRNHRESLERGHAFLYSAELCIATKDAGKALRYLSKALRIYRAINQISKEVAKIDLNSSIIAFEQNNIEDAKVFIFQAVQLYEDIGDSSLELADAYKFAAEVLSNHMCFHGKLSALGPNSSRLAFSDSSGGEYPQTEVRQWLNAALQVYQQHPLSSYRSAEIEEIYWRLIGISIELRDFDEAELCLRARMRLISDAGTLNELRATLIAVLSFQKRFSEAESLIVDYMNSQSLSRIQSVEGYNDLGVLYWDMGRHEEAVDYFAEASHIVTEELESSSKYLYACMNLVFVYRKFTRDQEVDDFMRKLISLKVKQAENVVAGSSQTTHNSFFESCRLNEISSFDNYSNLILSYDIISKIMFLYAELLAFTGRLSEAENIVKDANIHARSEAEEGLETREEHIAYSRLFRSFLPNYRLITNMSTQKRNYAVVSILQRDFRKARDVLQEIISDYYGFIPIDEDAAAALLNLGAVSIHLHEYAKAKKCVQSAMSLFREMGTDSSYIDTANQCLELLAAIEQQPDYEPLEVPFMGFAVIQEPKFSPQVRASYERMERKKSLPARKLEVE